MENEECLSCSEPVFFHAKPITSSGSINCTWQEKFCIEKGMGSATCWFSVAPYFILWVNTCIKTRKSIPLKPVNSSLWTAVSEECVIGWDWSNLSIPKVKELSTGRYSSSEMIWSVQLIFKWWLWRLWDLGSVICISINTSSEILKCCWRPIDGSTYFQLNV